MFQSKGNALTSDAFAAFINEHQIQEFYIAGADATACVKSTCYNMRKAGYMVHVISDCITSYDKKKIDEMLVYYESKGCNVKQLHEVIQEQNILTPPDNTNRACYNTKEACHGQKQGCASASPIPDTASSA